MLVILTNVCGFIGKMDPAVILIFFKLYLYFVIKILVVY